MATRIVDNGTFDPRITSIPASVARTGKSAALKRGWIIQDKPVKGVRYRTNFLYNPSVVNVSHSINNNVLTDENAINPYDVTKNQQLLPLQQSVSFSLLFDRTYELWDASRVVGMEKYEVSRLGVAWDVLSLYKMTGIASPIEIASESSEQKDSAEASGFAQGNFKDHASGPMLYVPVYVVFGNTLDYYGIIQSLDIQYTHWTWDLVPSRCQVSINMSLLPRGGAKNTARPAGQANLPGVDYNPGGDSILNPANNGKAGR